MRRRYPRRGRLSSPNVLDCGRPYACSTQVGMRTRPTAGAWAARYPVGVRPNVRPKVVVNEPTLRRPTMRQMSARMKGLHPPSIASRGGRGWRSVDDEDVARRAPEDVLVDAALDEPLEESLSACSDHDQVHVPLARELHDRLGGRSDGGDELGGEAALVQEAACLVESLARRPLRFLGFRGVGRRRDVGDDERRAERLGDVDGTLERLGARVVVGDQDPLVYRHVSRKPKRSGAVRCQNAPMTTLPSGTVTFVFSDIEGSTGLLKRLGERYGELIAEHRRIVRETYGAHGGVEIDAQGDALFFAFARARDAVSGAVAAQRAHAEQGWPGGEDVRVRMGLHTGEPALGEEGYLGLDVVRAARLCSAGQGGHVLLSETTRALLGSSLPDGVSVHPLGERRLKDIDEPERVYALTIEGIDAPEGEPPALREPAVDWERRFDELGERLAERINEDVFRSLQRSLGESR